MPTSLTQLKVSSQQLAFIEYKLSTRLSPRCFRYIYFFFHLILIINMRYYCLILHRKEPRLRQSGTPPKDGHTPRMSCSDHMPTGFNLDQTCHEKVDSFSTRRCFRTLQHWDHASICIMVLWGHKSAKKIETQKLQCVKKQDRTLVL